MGQSIPCQTAALVSFIIPAHNEQDYIDNTISSIKRFIGDRYEYEVIVVDHASSDMTAERASAAGAKVYSVSAGTVAMVRNTGARHARGDLFVFLDADVTLTLDWMRRFPDALCLLKENPLIITGSHCNVPEDGCWIERCWFRNFALEKASTHLGTGHLIISKTLFDNVGGFNEQLETGEDYEFCQRAKSCGAVIHNDPTLRVVHHGFPKDLRSFMRREAWHGKGDLVSVGSFLRSKVAIAAAIFTSLHISVIYSVTFKAVDALLLAANVMAIMALVGGSSILKFKHSPAGAMLCNAVIFYFYYWGRSLAMWLIARDAIRNKYKTFHNKVRSGVWHP